MRISDWSSNVCSSDLREAIVALVRTGWPTTDRILPEAIDLATPPNLPGWSIGTLDERRARARSVVAAWESAHDAPLRLRIALPDGTRSEERRVGNACVRTCSSRWAPSH